jgi:muramoyltetrapeptide carboxypeptidase
VDAVFCARGGSGCLRLLDDLNWTATAAARPKPLIGSSDVTVLLHVLAARLGVPTVFGPMVATAGFATDTVARSRLTNGWFTGRASANHPPRPLIGTTRTTRAAT